MAVAVISGAFVGIGKDLVRLVDLLELFCGVFFRIAVRVELESEFAERLFYIIVRGVSFYAEDFIVISFGGHAIILLRLSLM